MFGSSQVRFTTRTLLFLLENFHRYFKFLQSTAGIIATFSLKILLTKIFSYSLFPNILTFEYCALLGYYAASIGKIYRFFRTTNWSLLQESNPMFLPNLQLSSIWIYWHSMLVPKDRPKRLQEITTTLYVITQTNIDIIDSNMERN